MKNKFWHPLKRILILALFSGFTSLLSVNCPAQTNHHVLIITGGHGFEREAFFDMFKDMKNVVFEEIIHPKANNVYNSSVMDDFDVLLFYDMVQDIDAKQKKAFIHLLKKGKAIVFLHHSLVSYQGWDEFEKIIGGRYIQSNDKKQGSTYRHDVDIPVEIVNNNHPLTLGMDNFTIHDEVYGNYRVSTTVKPLLKTKHPESEEIIAWTNHYGKSPIVYIQLGHDHNAYENPHYRQLIKQAIEWTISQLPE